MISRAKKRKPIERERKDIKVVQVEFDGVKNPTVIFRTMYKWRRDENYPILMDKIFTFIRKRLRNTLSDIKVSDETATKMISMIKKPFPDINIIVALKREFDAVELRDAAKKMIKGDIKKKIDETGRERSRLNDIKEMLDEAGKVNEYYDIGSSEGNITKVVSNYLKINNVYAFDIDIEERKEGNIIYIRNKSNKIDKPSNSADLVTTFMSLHHFDDLKAMLKEIKRVLKPGKKFIIRDHDTSNKYLAEFFNLTHLWYMVAAGDEISPEEFVKNFAVFYKTKERWIELIKKAGFIFDRWVYPVVRRKKDKMGRKKKSTVDQPVAFYAMFRKPLNTIEESI
uniref:SAM dependent methyltransferase n=1 Tax=Pithovirus LCPAC403 TaxID=2506596 RepID=A0A481ZAZ0_9VIRU|nr:MAG: SAM dependent methyltransferase [Pithovirus LCPAC403]